MPDGARTEDTSDARRGSPGHRAGAASDPSHASTSRAAAVREATPNAPRSLTDLFVAFTLLALQGFGGVLAVAQRELVDRRGWLTREEFLEVFSVSQLLPGPNIVNLSLILGDRFFGWRGALAALAGMLAVPLAIVLVLAAAYGQWADHPLVGGALRGMGAVAAGLMIAMALKLLLALGRNPLGPVGCGLLGIATVVAVAILRVHLAWAIVGFGAIGWSLALWRLTRGQPRP